ncbi:hypothetical protein NP233_g438 [Leucocoprinus birnbaumii]|uniref:Transcription regulator Rua1 C-terminal domain-containing protein n=1 Tax=Leucocoprinus birnbaumii TaxID=56174 RepID=A0AAD5W2A1_9AGAR|nr:hypothetical protein NP233_g438 [Leucocoprinus birnbaumii]
MSSFYPGALLHQDLITDNISRVLTPWNYLSISPAPIRPQRSKTRTSSDSTRTLLDTPSPRLLAFASRDLAHTPVLLEVEAENILQSTPFEKHFGVTFSPAWLRPMQEVSPVVRASSSQEAVASSPGERAISPPKKQIPRASVPSPIHVMYSSDPGEDDESDFSEEYHFDMTDADGDGEIDDEMEETEDEEEITHYIQENSFLRRLHSVDPDNSDSRLLPPRQEHSLVLGSPCKIQPATVTTSPPSTAASLDVAYSDTDDNNSIEEDSPVQPHAFDGLAQSKDPPKTPEQSRASSPLSPLTPLTPLTRPATPLGSPVVLPTVSRRTTRSLSSKRNLDDDSFQTLAITPKRPRLSLRIPPRTKATLETTLEPTGAPSSTSPPVAVALTPIFTSRTFPSTIEISSKFPLFYRRYPISSYFQPPHLDSPFALLNARDPGGTYNPPRSAFDLYTPRFVKGKGPGKLGLCPICVEPLERGGENRKNWLAMKFSAFKCYHMQYAHGISAATGRPFAPPSAFQLVARPNAAKKERSQILQGKCQKCRKWVPVEGVKDVESKVKELVWWKHAASCYQDTTVAVDERDYFEHDAVFTAMEGYHVPS